MTNRNARTRSLIVLVALMAVLPAARSQDIFAQTFDVSGHAAAYAVAVDSTGVYVCLSGLSSGAGDWNYLGPRQSLPAGSLQKLSLSGSVLWTRAVGSGDSTECAVALGGGRAYVLRNRS